MYNCNASSAKIVPWGNPFKRLVGRRISRDRVGSWLFVLQKKLAIWLHRVLPGYVPLYTMIEFTRIPYADALRRAQWQSRIIAGLLLVGVVVVVLAVLLTST